MRDKIKKDLFFGIKCLLRVFKNLQNESTNILKLESQCLLFEHAHKKTKIENPSR